VNLATVANQWDRKKRQCKEGMLAFEKKSRKGQAG
jgi:hypothetical protein